MSMNATDDVVSNSATFFATVDFPEPLPPAMPMIKGFNMLFKPTTTMLGTHYARCDSNSTFCRPGSAMKSRLIIFVLLVLGAAACNALKRGSNIDPNARTVVQVDNQGFSDMTVYAARSAQRVRLGTAIGNSKTNFDIPKVLISGLTPLRFVADPIGGRRASVSEEITVAPGDTVVLTIPPI